MFSLISSLFASSSKWLYIALVAISVAFIGVSSLSISLYGDKSALSAEIVLKDKDIKDRDNLINDQAEKIKILTSDLANRNADIQTQNALIEQNRIDMAAKEKEYQKAMAKKPKIVTDIKYVPTGDDECKDLKNIIDEYISTGAQQ